VNPTFCGKTTQNGSAVIAINTSKVKQIRVGAVHFCVVCLTIL